jgi:Tfp pilus assembly protein PilX
MGYMKKKQFLNKEDGSITVLALILLVLLTLLGIAVTTTSSIEVQIAGNDDRYKKALYEADGGTEVGFEMLEQNIACPNGFNFTGSLDIGDVTVFTNAFWLIENEPTGDYPSDTVRDIRIYNTDTGPHTNLSVYGSTQLSTGSAIQMVAGYEGKGKGAASGGAHIVYNVYSKHMGRDNSRSMVTTQWRHMVGQEGACNY